VQAGMILRIIQGKRSSSNGPSPAKPSVPKSSAPEGLQSSRPHTSGERRQEDRSTPEMRELVRDGIFCTPFLGSCGGVSLVDTNWLQHTESACMYSVLKEC
jgi:hypothetical protein